MDEKLTKEHVEQAERSARYPQQVDRAHGQAVDTETFEKALRRGDQHFTLVGQDCSSPVVIIEWIKQNIETCPAPKLYEALARAIQMRGQSGRRRAD